VVVMTPTQWVITQLRYLLHLVLGHVQQGYRPLKSLSLLEAAEAEAEAALLVVEQVVLCMTLLLVCRVNNL
jgi:hypothetical protein